MSTGDMLGGRFTIIGELGRGGMATVYLADDVVRGERVAFKVLHEHLANDPDARARLRREVQAAARIRHPGILAAREIHEFDGRLALSMPVHRGCTLQERVAGEGPLPVDLLEQIAIELSTALAEAHRIGVLHRDITPNNILLQEDRALLADFGLASLEDHATATAGALGTFGYTAPEVYEGIHRDPRSDVYSLGAALYLAATGVAPFEAPSAPAILGRQLAEDARPIAELRADLPPHLAHTIEAMLERDPDHRPQGAREVHEALLAGEVPDRPEAALVRGFSGTPGELPTGSYTLVVNEGQATRRRRDLRNVHGPIEPHEAADPEHMLAAAVAHEAGLAAAPEQLPECMRRVEFKLVEGVNHATAEHLYAVAETAGFEPHLVPRPHVDSSPRLGRGVGAIASVALLIVGMFLMLAGSMWVSFYGVSVGIPILGGLFAAFGGILFAFTLDARKLRLAFERVLEGPTAAPSPRERGEGDLLSDLCRRTLGRLDGLEKVVDARRADLPDATLATLRDTVASLRDQARTLRLRAAAEAAPPRSEAAGRAVQRIHARLGRLETLARAGEAVDAAERQRLEAALEAHRREADTREEFEARRTLVAARLLEIGAAANRASRVLRRDEGLASTHGQVERLVGESLAVAEVLAEMKAPRLCSEGPPPQAPAPPRPVAERRDPDHS